MEDSSINSTAGTLPQPLMVLLNATADELMRAIAATEPQDINRLPCEGLWTAGQNIEHVRLSVSGTIALLNGPVKDTNRSPDQFVKAIKALFLDFDAKYPSAPVLIPADKQYDKENLIAELGAAFEALKDLVQTKEMTDTCLAAEFTGMGYLTRLEWATVAIYHTQRHIHQLAKIKKCF